MLWTAFLLGLAGSLHCAGMCGPLAMAAPAVGAGLRGRLISRLAYNCGRTATYSTLGLGLGIFGKSLALVGLQRWVSVGAGVVILLSLAFSFQLKLAGPMAKWVALVKARFGGLFRKKTLGAALWLGALNGFLPCGLVYAAGAGAVASGGLIGGAVYMAVFGAGTIPMMLALGMTGSAIPFRARLKLQKLVPVSVGVVAVGLILRGMALGIPYLSPNLAAGRCH